jgi:hypothetical protein
MVGMSIYNLPNNFIQVIQHNNETSIKGLSVGAIGLPEIIERNCFYADKTKLISLLEKSNACNHVIHRPKGTGKSTTLSMLRAFYDVAYSQVYSNIFEELEISTQDIPTRNSFCILDFDLGFSARSSDLKDEIIYGINLFCAKYHLQFSFDENAKITRILADFFNCYLRSERSEPIYVLIDNYNDFNVEDPLKIKDSKTKSIIRYCDFFGALEKAEQHGIVSRIFMTGVMPIDHNIDAQNISFSTLDLTFDKDYSTSVGFTEKDVNNLVKATLLPTEQLSYDQLTDNLCNQLDGYCFSPKNKGVSTIINTRTCLQYLSYLKSPVTTPIANVHNHTHYHCLKKIYESYPDIINSINSELTNNGSFSLYLTFCASAENVTEKVVTLLFFTGILTIKETMTAPNGEPLTSFRLTNVYTTEIWNELIKETQSLNSEIN